MWTRRTFAFAATTLIASTASARDALTPEISDATLTHSDGRKTTVRVFAPGHRRARAPALVFSHGANSNGALYDRLLAPLAASSGFLIVAPTHVDAETNTERAKFTPDAVLQTRLADIRLATDQLETIAGQRDLRLHPQHIAIAGHSYGALLALYLVGAGFRPRGLSPDAPSQNIRDPRYRCALAVSPPGPLPNFLAKEQFDTIAAPIMVTTGEKDVLPGFVNDWRERLMAFERTPTKPAFAVVTKDADHYFGGEIARLTVPGPKTPADLAVTAMLSAHFLRAFALNARKDARTLRRFIATPPSPATMIARL